MKRSSDEDLLARGLSDAEAFGAFYRRHEQTMLVYFLRRTGDPELAADLTAETFAAALESLSRFSPGERPAVAWLFGIARHKFLRSLEVSRVEDIARRRLRLEPLELDDTVLARIEQLGEDERVNRMLDQLPIDQALAVQGRVVNDMSYTDLAGRLRCSEAVARKRVSRGLMGLRRRIKEAS